MPEPVHWGPDNTHPHSQMKTELVWEGKYDEYGRRHNVDVAGAACPEQKIETVDIPRSEALASGQTTLGELSTTVREDFRNRLIWGDNKLVMASCPPATRAFLRQERNLRHLMKRSLLGDNGLSSHGGVTKGCDTRDLRVIRDAQIILCDINARI